MSAAGAAATSEPMLGSTLAVIGAQWLAQVAHIAYATERLGDTSILHQHHVGIAGYVNSAYVDLQGSTISTANLSGSVDKENAAFLTVADHMSILESTTVQQTTNIAAVSTVKLLDIAAASGLPIYSATSTNYASAVQPNLVNCSSYYPSFNAYLNAGWRLIVPSRCDLTENRWAGVGYFVVNSNTVGSMISGGLFGGFADAPQDPGNLNSFVGQDMSWWASLVNAWWSGTYNDPVDLVSGNFLYDHEDINVGVGTFPQSLSFKRSYSSGMRNQNGSLGKGWAHNLQASVAVNSDGFQGMGEDSALDAVGALVEMKASLDLLSDSTRPTDKLVAAVLGQRWFGEQLTNNTVIVTRGVNGEVFVKLPDGTYNPPPGNSAKLTQNADGTYNYEFLNRAVLKFNAAGQAGTYADPSGIQVNYSYTGNLLTSVTNSLGRTLNFTYTNGRLSQVSDGTRSVSYGYDSNANLTTFTNTVGAATTFTYGQPGQLKQIFYPSFPTTAAVTNTYDTLGRVQTQTNARGKVYNYYFAGSRSAEVGPGGVTKTNYIDALGNVLQKSTPLLNWTVNTYDGHGRLVSTQLPQGNGVTYTYDDVSCASAEKRCTHNVRTMSKVGAAGSGMTPLTLSFTYESAFNKVATATDARGNVTSYTYTAQGQPLQMTSPIDASGVAPQTSYGYVAYTPTGFPTFYLPSSKSVRISSTNSTVTATSYDSTNQYVPKTSTVDSGTGTLNLTTTFTYDRVGNLTQVVGPRTDVVSSVSTAYDSERRATQVTDAVGKQTQTTYDADGRPVSVARQIGTQWLVNCSRYSATGKIVRAWGPAQTAAATTCPTESSPVPITDTAYDDLDRANQVTQYLAAGDGGNRVTQTVYNADDTVQRIDKAVGTSIAQSYVQYTYTPNGNLNSSQDAKGNLTVYAYDGFDRRTRIYYPQPSTPGSANTNDYEEYAYDANGNVSSMRKRTGDVITQTWDNLNRLTARTYPSSSDNVQFGYDLRGLRTASQYANGSHTITYVWDNAGRLINTTAGGKTLTYQYDAAGNRVQTTWPDAFYTTTSYDALNRPNAIKENGSVNLASYAYDDLSRRTTVTLGNGTTIQRSYDNQGALATLKNFLASTSEEVQYTYTRNQIRELTGITWSNNTYQWTGATTGTQTYTSDGLNRYTGLILLSYSYDSNGNLAGDGTWNYSYDLDNRLKTASKLPSTSATLAYDAEGRLRQTAVTLLLTTTTTNLLYDGQNLVAEYDSTGNTVLRKYVHGPGTDEPIVWYEGAGTTAKNWLYSDHLGSIVATANAAGARTATYSYGPYGEPNVTTGLRFRYTGQQLLGDLGLYYYKGRFYSPTLGRFLQTDPIGYKDDENLYAYVGNNPVNRTDPTGLSFVQTGSTDHRYQIGPTYLCTEGPGCTRGIALQVVDGFSLGILTIVNGAPSQGYNLLLPTNDPIQHIVDYDRYAIFNITLPGHQFFPGQVEHSITYGPGPDGVGIGIYLTTVGTGSGPRPGWNNFLGYLIFTPTHVWSVDYFQGGSSGGYP
ncbi:RHS repeat-associated core domain-containing protein [Ralstonia pickettii]